MEIQEIKQILKERKITYDDLAKMTGLSKSCITKIFGGFAKYPRVDTMEAIETALGLNVSQSYATTNAKTEGSASSLTEKETRLILAFNGLIPPMQDYILDMVEKLVAQPQNANKRA